MAEETLASQEIPVTKVTEDAESNGVPIKKEPTCVADEKPHVVERTPNDPETTQELLESQEKVNELEHELQRISSALKESESINTHLKDELLLTKEQHQESAKKHEDLECNHKNLLEKVSEAEEKLEILPTGIRENELLDKLKQAEEKLEQRSQLLEKANARSTKLELSHQTLIRDSDLKFQEAIGKFTNRDSEAKVLYEKVQVLENEVNSYQEQLASHMNTITELTENHSKVSEFHSAAEARISEAEARLEEATKLSIVLSKKDDKAEELKTARNEIEELTRRLASESEKLQSQKESSSEKELERAAALKHIFVGRN
ncbi:hypothetical protein BUALT_Bualt03G0217800 [Buddleja alternifolia]|uniref:Uncharacterized protein n=1 Tax=Buddleja alternifolia TaxID=168488 RepID=A0AAV6XVP6_9LAMI|nr:hypothetical protein BUALT_Bualt03G0217800 [Buddleja alternifolia]